KYGKDPLRGLAENNDFDVREWTYIKKDGTKITVQVTISAIKNAEGEIIGSLNVASDITAIKNAENELLKKNQVLNFAERLTMIGNWQWNTITDEVRWSANLYKIFGLDVEQQKVTYDTYFSFVHPEDREMVTNHVQMAIKENSFPDLVHRIQLRDGTVKNIQLLAEIMTNDAGEVIELIGTCQDVTEQRLAEKKFRGLLESAPDAMVITDEQGKINMINRQAEKLFGYSVQELIGEPMEKLIPDGFMASDTEDSNTILFNSQIGELGEGKELVGINKSGRPIPIQISRSPLKTEEGVLVSTAIRDISTQKAAERKILEAKESLEIFSKKLVTKNKQLADFNQITSHNLRAPVSNLNSLLGFYKHAQSDGERNDLFQKFETVINHLTLTLN